MRSKVEYFGSRQQSVRHELETSLAPLLRFRCQELNLNGDQNPAGDAQPVKLVSKRHLGLHERIDDPKVDLCPTHEVEPKIRRASSPALPEARVIPSPAPT